MTVINILSQKLIRMKLSKKNLFEHIFLSAFYQKKMFYFSCKNYSFRDYENIQEKKSCHIFAGYIRLYELSTIILYVKNSGITSTWRSPEVE